jgi:hypothetical protein
MQSAENNHILSILPFPTEVLNEINSFWFDQTFLTHKKHMRKICYMFRNARASRYLSHIHKERNGPNDEEFEEGELWKICLSRGLPKSKDYWQEKINIAWNRTINEFNEQFSQLFNENTELYKAFMISAYNKAVCNIKKIEKKLEEKRFGARNCKNCGSYKCSQMRWLYSRKTRVRFDMDRVDLLNRDELSHKNRIMCQCVNV